MKNIREDLNKLKHKLSKSKIEEIRKNLYKIESNKNLSTQKIEEIEKIVFLGLRRIMIMMMQNAEK